MSNISIQEQQHIINGGIQQDDRHRRAPYRHSKTVRYMECLKNHATALCGHATDGCNEFMGGGEEGTIEALICCACKCHRNFHRQVIIQPCSNPFCCSPSSGPPPVPVVQVTTNYVEAAAVMPMRRFRTKFTPGQKELMLAYAQKSGWKIPKADDPEVKRVCEEIGVEWKVLKVWMHNNKYHPNKKVQKAESSSMNQA